MLGEVSPGRLLEHADGSRAQGQLGEHVLPGQKLSHGAGAYVILRHNEGIAGVKARFFKTGGKARLAHVVAGDGSVGAKNKGLSTVGVAVGASSQVKVFACASAVTIQKCILIEYGTDHLDSDGSGRNQ